MSDIYFGYNKESRDEILKSNMRCLRTNDIEQNFKGMPLLDRIMNDNNVRFYDVYFGYNKESQDEIWNSFMRCLRMNDIEQRCKSIQLLYRIMNDNNVHYERFDDVYFGYNKESQDEIWNSFMRCLRMNDSMMFV
jgi:hypothetical protein